MSLNSVNTNISAQVALQSLNSTNSQLQATQKRISTGFRVSDATDDGAAFAVAQKVRADVGSLTTVNQQLGNAKGLVDTAVTSLTSISDNVKGAKALLVEISNQSNSNEQRAQYLTSFKNLVTLVANAVDGSQYGGTSLLGKAAGAVPPSATGTQVINSDSGTSSTLSSEDSSGTAGALAALVGATFSRDAAGNDTFTGSLASPPTDADVTTAQADATTALTGVSTPTGTNFASLQSKVLNSLNQAGADSNLLDATITFNSAKIDSLNAGLGALIDADLSKESANLQSLQIRQQLGTQSLSLANQAPQALLSLFK